MTPVGMAMYQGSAVQGFRSGQTKEISLTIASFFYSCNIPAHNASAPAFREMAQALRQSRWHPQATPPPPITPQAMANCWRGPAMLLRPECRVQYRVQDVAQFGWSLCSGGMTWLRRGLVNFVFQSATSGPVFPKCVDAPGHVVGAGTKNAEFIAEQTPEVLEDSELLGRRLSSYKVAHCYAQTPWILRWVGLSSLLTPPPYRPRLTLSPLFGQLFDTPDLVPTPGGHPEPFLLTSYVSQMDTPTICAARVY
jgi:hypothetical protein